MIVSLILLTIVLVLAIKFEAKDIYGEKEIKGGNGLMHYKGRGDRGESIDQLLNRIYWVADSDSKNNKWKRAVIVSFVSTIIILLLFFSKVPGNIEVLLLFIIIFVVTIALFGFFRFHSDRFSAYYIRENINRIKEKLELKKYEEPEEPKNDPPPYNKLSLYV